MGERTLSKTQFGVESTRGTAVAATRVLGCAPKKIPNDRIWEGVRYADGRRSMRTKHRYDQLLVEDSLTFDDENPLYFQVLPVLLQCLLDGTVSPAEQTGSQSDYLWDFNPSFTAANAPDTITLEMGDDVQAYEIEYVMGKQLVVAWQIPDDGGAAPVTAEWDYFGRQVTPTTFTASQALHTGLEMINGKLSRLYLDTAWGSLGGTEQTSLLRGGEISLLTGNHPKPMASADKFFSTHGEGKVGAMVQLDLEGSAAADSIYDIFRAGTTYALRLDFNGSQIGSGDNYLFRLDLHGYFELVEPMNEERQGNNLHRALFVSEPDSSGNELEIDVLTNHNAL